MIKNFKDTETQKVYQRQRSRKLPSDIQQVALRKLRMINSSISINDLRVPPANRLEKLSGIEQVNGVFGLMTNGVFAFVGKVVTLLMLKLRIITRLAGKNV